MDIQDTFPQRVWQIVASIRKDLSRPTVMSPGLPVPSGGASGRRSVKTSAGRQHFTMASGGEPPRRNITYRAGSTAATSGITGGRRGGVGKRTNRFTTLSLGILTLSVTERVGAGLILGRRRNGRRRIDPVGEVDGTVVVAPPLACTGTAVCCTGTSVRSALVPPLLITGFTLSVINTSLLSTVMAALRRIRALG